MALIELISKDLNIDVGYLNNIAKRNDLYKKFYIPHNTKKRKILQPTKELKVVQYWMCKKFFCDFPKSEFSRAYDKGCSIQKNAKVHANNNYILHMDIKNFFPSIDREMVKKLFDNNQDIVRKWELDERDIDFILNIVLYRGNNLVIGSVASPLISNLVMLDFDNKIYSILKKEGDFTYTRYADDIVVSSQHFIPSKLITDIETVIKEYGFYPNKNKTYFMNKSSRRQVTGVVIDNNTNCVTIGTSRYKEIKSYLYKFLVKKEGNINQLQGYLAFVRDVNEKQYEQLKNIYSRYDKNKQLFI